MRPKRKINPRVSYVREAQKKTKTILEIKRKCTGSGRSEGSGSISGGSLGGTGIIHGMIFNIIRQSLAPLQPLQELRVGDITRHHELAG
jgi:hypothetical protein